MKTITYDETKFQLLPISLDGNMLEAAANTELLANRNHGEPASIADLWDALRAAAPQPECVEQVVAPDHGWLSMDCAPKDDTAILVLIPHSDVPHAVRWRGQGWVMTWDFHPLSEHDQPRYWMPCPGDPDAAQPQEPSHDDK